MLSAALTVMDDCALVPTLPNASVTETLNENVPDAVGVPVICPVLLFSSNPVGKFPDETTQFENGP
jgi:hypothetical protein